MPEKRKEIDRDTFQTIKSLVFIIPSGIQALPLPVNFIIIMEYTYRYLVSFTVIYEISCNSELHCYVCTAKEVHTYVSDKPLVMQCTEVCFIVCL